MKRILIISKNFPPAVGGIERLAHSTLLELAKDYACEIIVPSGGRHFAPSNVKVREVSSGGIVSFLWKAFFEVVRAVATRNYAVCVAQSGVVAPLAWVVSRVGGIPFVTFVHGLDLLAESNALQYQRIFVGAIRRANLVIANSDFTAGIARSKGIATRRVKVLKPAILPPGPAVAKMDFREQHKIHDQPILLFVGRLIKRKGLVEFVRRALPLIIGAYPEALFLIVGEEPRRTRTDRVELSLRAAIRDVGLESSVKLLGRVSDEALEAAYSEAHVMVFPIVEMEKDAEGFGLVIIEAAARCVPTVAFAVGGVAEAIASSGIGTLVRPGDYVSFAEGINYLLTTVYGRRHQFGPRTRNATQDVWDAYGANLRETLKILTGD